MSWVKLSCFHAKAHLVIYWFYIINCESPRYDTSEVIFSILIPQFSHFTFLLWIFLVVRRVGAWIWWQNQLLGYALLHDHGGREKVCSGSEQGQGVFPSSYSYQGYVWLKQCGIVESDCWVHLAREIWGECRSTCGVQDGRWCSCGGEGVDHW